MKLKINEDEDSRNRDDQSVQRKFLKCESFLFKICVFDYPYTAIFCQSSISSSQIKSLHSVEKSYWLEPKTAFKKCLPWLVSNKPLLNIGLFSSKFSLEMVT